MQITRRVDFKNKKRESIIAAVFLFVAAIILEIYSLNTVESVAIQAQNRAVFWGPYDIFNQRIIDLIGLTLLSLPSVGLALTGYLLFESHPLGWKISLAFAGVFTALFIFGVLQWDQWLTIMTPILAGTAVVILNKKREDSNAGFSPAMTEKLAKFALRLSGLICIAILVGMVVYVGIRGSEYLSLDFITGKWNNMDAILVIGGQQSGSMGGISNEIIGSLLLVTVCEAVAIPTGLGAAIYLAEYAGQNKLTNVVRFFIEVLAGAPSVVIGLVGAALLVQQLQMGQSLLAAGLSLAMMTIPWNIRVAEEAIRSVPNSYREAAYALGATQSQTISKIVLLAASPGVITGIILGMGAAIGETAVVIFTAGNGIFNLPTSIVGLGQYVPSLPVWIYNAPSNVQSARTGEGMTFAYNLGYAGAFVLIILFLAICIVGLVLRNYLSKKIGTN